MVGFNYYFITLLGNVCRLRKYVRHTSVALTTISTCSKQDPRHSAPNAQTQLPRKNRNCSSHLLISCSSTPRCAHMGRVSVTNWPHSQFNGVVFTVLFSLHQMRACMRSTWKGSTRAGSGSCAAKSRRSTHARSSSLQPTSFRQSHTSSHSAKTDFH